MAVKDVSVVIGFKDWGLTRLRLSITTILESFGRLDGEVIVSDYGSAEPEANRRVVESLGATYVFTASDGTWSRSRALNAGFAKSSGRVLVSTDADMIFSPRSMEIIAGTILADPETGVLLQCRDLPQAWSDVEVDELGCDWAEFDAVARRRARWGMGGMMAVSRDTFMSLRGYDERMQTYGGEDVDFASRVRRSGAKLLWIEDPDVRMYHMWHPSTAAKHALSPSEQADVDANKAIMRQDKTFVRNVRSWTHRPPDAPPLVSVVISTFNRSHLLMDTIYSVQAQTVQDFEIVIVDDGSEDDTRQVIETLDDPRVRYVFQQNAGVASARNNGVRQSRGAYVVVLDDDDIALPWRLEAHFDALTEGVNATFGSFANFDNVTGELTLHRTKLFTTDTTADKGGAPGHSTWMVERKLFAALSYDESLPSGIDNNFALRALRSGLTWKHTGRVLTLRRMHPLQITAMDGVNQVSTARDAYNYFTFSTATWNLQKLRKERGSADYVAIMDSLEEDLVPFLPDHLVTRSIEGELVDAGDIAGVLQILSPAGTRRSLIESSDITWRELASLRGRLDLSQIRASRVVEEGTVPLTGPDRVDAAIALLRSELYAGHDGSPGHVMVQVIFETRQQLSDAPSEVRDETFELTLGDMWRGWWAKLLAVGDLDVATLNGLQQAGRLAVIGPRQTILGVQREMTATGAKGIA